MNRIYPKIENQEEILRNLCIKKLHEVYKTVDSNMEERLNYELDAIKQTETAAIFILLNRVFTNLSIKPYQFASRGLTGGSLVAYLCGFSNVDPIKYKLNQYLYFGLKDSYKEPDININLSDETNLKSKIIGELHSYKEIYTTFYTGKTYPCGISKRIPICYVLVPKISNYTEEDYHMLINHDNLREFYELDLIDFESIKLLESLINKTNCNLENLSIDDIDIINYLSNENYKEIFKNISDFDIDFNLFIDIANSTKPKTFYDLVKVFSFVLGTGAWNINIKLLLKLKEISLDEVISNRDDVYDVLIKHNFSIEESYKIAEDIRKGKGPYHKKRYKELFEEHNLLDWFIDTCTNIEFLPPRAHAISYTLIIWKLLWFKIHYPEEFKDKDLSCVFEEGPRHMGLRGDSYLWREMQEAFVGKSLGISVSDFATQICEQYAKSVGKSLTYGSDVFVERFSHGGMSSGWVCGNFWICYGIPFLLNKLRLAKAKYNMEPKDEWEKYEDEFITLGWI